MIEIMIGWILGLYYLLVILCLFEGGFNKKWQFFVSLIPFSFVIAWIYCKVKNLD